MSFFSNIKILLYTKAISWFSQKLSAQVLVNSRLQLWFLCEEMDYKIITLAGNYDYIIG